MLQYNCNIIWSFFTEGTGAMNLRILFLIILAIASMGCSTTIKKNSDAVGPLAEKSDDTYADGIMEGHKPPK